MEKQRGVGIMAKNINIIITTSLIAEKLFEIFKRERINCVVIPNCKGYSQKGSFFEFLGFTDSRIDFLAFQCSEKIRKVILKYLLVNYNQKNNGIMFSVKGGNLMEVKNKMMVAIVNHGYGEKVADVLRKEFSCGATILSGRGSGVDYESFMGMSIDADREIVVSVIPSKIYVSIKKCLKQNFENDETDLVCFSLPITNFDKLHRVSNN